jgi:hypothetical protein
MDWTTLMEGPETDMDSELGTGQPRTARKCDTNLIMELETGFAFIPTARYSLWQLVNFKIFISINLFIYFAKFIISMPLLEFKNKTNLPGSYTRPEDKIIYNHAEIPIRQWYITTRTSLSYMGICATTFHSKKLAKYTNAIRSNDTPKIFLLFLFWSFGRTTGSRGHQDKHDRACQAWPGRQSGRNIFGLVMQKATCSVNRSDTKNIFIDLSKTQHNYFLYQGIYPQCQEYSTKHGGPLGCLAGQYDSIRGYTKGPVKKIAKSGSGRQLLFFQLILDG